MPFFPCVLVHLIALDHGVAQRIAVQPDPAVLLESVPQRQQVPAVATQLTGHLGRRCPLGDAVEDHQDLGGTPLDALEESPGPGVEDASAGTALVVQDRLAVSAMDAHIVPFSASRASQTVGVQQFDKFGVASLLIEVFDQREIHGRVSAQRVVQDRRIPLQDTTIRSERQEAEHRIGLMSHPGFRRPR